MPPNPDRLTIHAELDTSEYRTGIVIADETVDDLAESGSLTSHEWDLFIGKP